MSVCTHCGYENAEGNFCANCGKPLKLVEDTAIVGENSATAETTKTLPAVVEERDIDALSAEDEAAVGALPQGSALLIVQRGPNAGARFLLNTDEVTAGRHQDSDIFLDDISVSRRHAIFLRTPQGTVLRDVGSLNGTYVNRDLIDGEYLLQHGDEVQLGKFRLIYFASSHGLATSSSLA